ncbi:MAG: OmpH family outer membrane protein [Fimbriiglobus sp.]
MNRAMVFVAALAGIGGAVYLGGATLAQTPAPAPAAAPAAKAPTGKVAVFNVAKVMREYKRWQYFAATMNNKRGAEAGGLGKLRSEIADLQAKIQVEPVQAKRDEMTKTMVAKQREFEDRERVVRKSLDEESAAHLKNLFAEIQQAVRAIVESNGFDMVLAYPDAVTEEERQSPLYFDLKMRPPAAMPFYVSPSVDTTTLLVDTLNKYFPAPGPIPGPAGPAQAGATADPAAPK